MGRRGHGEGSISQRKDGRWVATLTIGRTAAGKQRRQAFYGRTRKEVATRLKDAIRARDEGRPVMSSKQTVGEFLVRWLEDIKRPRLRPKSYYTYKVLIARHLAPGLGRIRLRDLDAMAVQAWLNAIELRPATVCLMRTILRSALKQAEAWGLVARNVAALTTPPRITPDERRYLTLDEVRTLLQAVDDHHDRALYHVALLLGLRQGELLGLRWADIDFPAARLSVTQQLVDAGGTVSFGQPKTARSKRTLPLVPSLAATLHAHRARQLQERLQRAAVWEEHGLVFPSLVGTPRRPNQLQAAFKRVLAKAGLPPVRFHDLRHACATLLAAECVPPRVAMEILGHATIAQTMERYAHVLEAGMQDAAETLERVLAKEVV